MENLLFSSIPAGISKADAKEMVHTALIKRKWTVSSNEGGGLKAELNHRRYKADLLFDFQDGEIRYSDRTLKFFKSQNTGKETWKLRPAPEDWINYLRQDVGKMFKYAALENLKASRDQGSMSKYEYQRREAEIQSQYGQ